MRPDLGPNNFQRLAEDKSCHLSPERGNLHTRFDLQTLHGFLFWFDALRPSQQFFSHDFRSSWDEPVSLSQWCKARMFLLVDLQTLLL